MKEGAQESMTTRKAGGLDFTAIGGKGGARSDPIVGNNAVEPGAKSRRGGIWKTPSYEPSVFMISV
jgi:hypothetical protein